MGGVGLQQVFIIIISILVIHLLWGVRRVEQDGDRARRATLILGCSTGSPGSHHSESYLLHLLMV